MGWKLKTYVYNDTNSSRIGEDTELMVMRFILPKTPLSPFSLTISSRDKINTMVNFSTDNRNKENGTASQFDVLSSLLAVGYRWRDCKSDVDNWYMGAMQFVMMKGLLSQFNLIIKLFTGCFCTTRMVNCCARRTQKLFCRIGDVYFRENATSCRQVRLSYYWKIN